MHPGSREQCMTHGVNSEAFNLKAQNLPACRTALSITDYGLRITDLVPNALLMAMSERAWMTQVHVADQLRIQPLQKIHQSPDSSTTRDNL